MAATDRPQQVRSDWLVAVATAVVALALLAANLRSSRMVPAPVTPHAAYVAQLTALLQRYDVSVAALDQVLTRRDDNPGLVGSADWLQQDATLARELQTEYDDSALLSPTASDAKLQECVVEALRLTSLGATMLHDGFLTDGHGAYYLGAHGNWNLNLGHQQIQRCRSILAGS